jgi:long-chain fatty acid transport protein
MHLKSRLTVVVLMVLLVPTIVCGAGFHIREQGAKAMGMANAFVAQADDPSAIFYNPAGLAFQSGTQVSLGVTVVNVPETTFKGTTNIGQSDASPAFLGETIAVDTEARSDVFFPPNFYATISEPDSPWAFGVGIGSLYPLAKSWANNSPFRDEIIEIAIKPINVNPTVAYRFDEWNLSIGVGVDYTYAQVVLEKTTNIDGVAVGLGESGTTSAQLGEVEIEADGDGWGYNFGLLWKPIETVSIGVAYRSEIELDFDGDADYLMTPYGQGALSSAVYDVKAKTEITLPDTWSFAVAWHPMERLTVECDADYFGWSSYDSLDIIFANNDVLPDSLNGKDWNDVWAYRLGAQYELTDSFDLRIGYARDNSPVPDATMGPELPDSDRNNYTFGVGYHTERAVIDFAYMWVDFDERKVDNEIQTGTYESDAHLFAANLTFFF